MNSHNHNHFNNRIASHKRKVKDYNELIVCNLCKGYLVAPCTTSCGHLFCHLCIVQYIGNSVTNKKSCPKCGVAIENIKPDILLRSVIYKIIPRLFQSETRETYRSLLDYYDRIKLEETQIDSDIKLLDQYFYSPDEPISLSLEYDLLSFGITQNKFPQKRYLQCPAAVKIGHLKKFLFAKYDLNCQRFAMDIDISYTTESEKTKSLNNELRLIDIIYIYGYKGDKPMAFLYRIFKKSKRPIRNNHNNVKKVEKFCSTAREELKMIITKNNSNNKCNEFSTSSSLEKTTAFNITEPLHEIKAKKISTTMHSDLKNNNSNKNNNNNNNSSNEKEIKRGNSDVKQIVSFDDGKNRKDDNNVPKLKIELPRLMTKITVPKSSVVPPHSAPATSSKHSGQPKRVRFSFSEEQSTDLKRYRYNLQEFAHVIGLKPVERKKANEDDTDVVLHKKRKKSKHSKDVPNKKRKIHAEVSSVDQHLKLKLKVIKQSNGKEDNSAKADENDEKAKNETITLNGNNLQKSSSKTENENRDAKQNAEKINVVSNVNPIDLPKKDCTKKMDAVTVEPMVCIPNLNLNLSVSAKPTNEQQSTKKSSESLPDLASKNPENSKPPTPKQPIVSSSTQTLIRAKMGSLSNTNKIALSPRPMSASYPPNLGLVVGNSFMKNTIDPPHMSPMRKSVKPSTSESSSQVKPIAPFPAIKQLLYTNLHAKMPPLTLTSDPKTSKESHKSTVTSSELSLSDITKANEFYKKLSEAQQNFLKSQQQLSITKHPKLSSTEITSTQESSTSIHPLFDPKPNPIPLAKIKNSAMEAEHMVKMKEMLFHTTYGDVSKLTNYTLQIPKQPATSPKCSETVVRPSPLQDKIPLFLTQNPKTVADFSKPSLPPIDSIDPVDSIEILARDYQLARDIKKIQDSLCKMNDTEMYSFISGIQKLQQVSKKMEMDNKMSQSTSNNNVKKIAIENKMQHATNLSIRQVPNPIQMLHNRTKKNEDTDQQTHKEKFEDIEDLIKVSKLKKDQKNSNLEKLVQLINDKKKTPPSNDKNNNTSNNNNNNNDSGVIEKNGNL